MSKRTDHLGFVASSTLVAVEDCEQLVKTENVVHEREE